MPFKRVIMDPTRSVPLPTARDGCRSCTQNLLPKSRDRSRTDAASTSAATRRSRLLACQLKSWRAKGAYTRTSCRTRGLQQSPRR